MSLASSAAEHHVAPQALLLVLTWSRALPSLSELPAGKRASEPSSSTRRLHPSLEHPGELGLPPAPLLLTKQEWALHRLSMGGSVGLIPCSCGGTAATPVLS